MVDGASVEVASRRGRAVLPVTVTDRVLPGGCSPPSTGTTCSVSTWPSTPSRTTRSTRSPSSPSSRCALWRSRPSPRRSNPSCPTSGRSIASARRPLAGCARAAPWVRRSGSTRTAASPRRPRTSLPRRVPRGARGGGEPGTPVLPPTAPLDADDALWVDGLLAGLFSRPRRPTSRGVRCRRAATAPRQVVVLWASQTGKAEDLAVAAAQRLVGAGLAPRTVAMDDCHPADLPTGADLVVVTSTFCDGDAPDNGTAFWESVAAVDAPRARRVAVRGARAGRLELRRFCGHGRRLDAPSRGARGGAAGGARRLRARGRPAGARLDRRGRCRP